MDFYVISAIAVWAVTLVISVICALAYHTPVPTPSGMRKLLSICENYATEFKILFNIAKSKCIFIAPSEYRTARLSPIPEFYEGGYHIEYTDHWLHLRYDLTLSSFFMLSRERVICCVGCWMGVNVGARVSLVRELLLIRSGVLSFSDLAFSGIDVDLMIDSLSRSV
jgi:hypothetical protein